MATAISEPSLRKTSPDPRTCPCPVATSTVTMAGHTFATIPIRLGPALIEGWFCTGCEPADGTTAEAVVTGAPG